MNSYWYIFVYSTYRRQSINANVHLHVHVHVQCMATYAHVYFYFDVHIPVNIQFNPTSHGNVICSTQVFCSIVEGGAIFEREKMCTWQAVPNCVNKETQIQNLFFICC